MPSDTVRLGRGSHERPADGHCLMEYASLLDGGPFTLLPRGTHPVVAALAAGINDRTSDDRRDELASRAPRLLRAQSVDPALAWRLVGLCAEVVLAHRSEDRAARRRSTRARRAVQRWRLLVPPRVRTRLPRWFAVAASVAALDELLVAFRAVLGAVGEEGSAARDHALAGLLDATLDVADAVVTAERALVEVEES